MSANTRNYSFLAACVASTFVAVSAAAAADGAAADTGQDHGRPHCIAPWGIDWNKVLDVDDADIVSGFCTEVHVGDHYTPEILWITNTITGQDGHPVLYPPGYVPSRKAPMDDFLKKLQRVRYILQPSGQEWSFRARDIEELVTVGDLYRGAPDSEFTPPQYVWPTTALLGELPPLPPGSYSVDIHFVMSDTHCDGQTDDFDSSCLVPGDNVGLTRTFTVVH